ncbi:4a-hydroxytetrahydrobiopterin dehydratase [Nakamurella flavida]|uniref:Putative pterin-4-alpha-carbinolamine dehydratase n=1 Tax=Nakamurella flavida TaxID=363630 RepID=A0A938YJA7_9ACTN|nr:4a-hydroxytetrahydrobiopterin dehydratase [Nakamurella flavida]MBM9477022.1 4a-hydroxytetrahydrobiopterin dehydratase [Nakamurella flavida]MDP9779967.1 4a-hydroxytetrahydrobiopterin dehydratase [Nakamurella flavida]
MTRTLAPAEIHHLLRDLPGWVHFDGALRACFRAPDFAAAVALVGDVGAAAEQADHHPDVHLRHREVELTLTTHSARGVTGRDLQLAGTIDARARDRGARSVPVRHTRIELAVDTAAASAIRPFWVAAFGGREVTTPDGDREVHGPDGARVWFQAAEKHRPGRGRMHVDVYLPDDQVEARVRAVQAAGGLLVTDRFAPGWWVLADADGNEVCICRE